MAPCAGSAGRLFGQVRLRGADDLPELRAAGCERVFVDHGESSRVTDRPQWVACLDYLRPGDTLKVRRLDRLAGSERILIETLQDLDARQVNIVSLTEPMIDTTSPMGRALFGIVAVFAQLRVDTIRDNTQRGLDYARAGEGWGPAKRNDTGTHRDGSPATR
ncbi:recombinase family protein [Microbacterium oleivorans]|uniref:recombinase family protein n=1 Tax=Microbacterium oleivorans TaxID=273677 RepID=UPI002116E3DD|nr:recombinase family protein [Microbacterium oleivorans]